MLHNLMLILYNSYSFIADDPADFDLFLSPSPKRTITMIINLFFHEHTKNLNIQRKRVNNLV